MTHDTYNVLTLDGGGLRGIITAVYLERLEAACPGFLANVDLFVGTSTGGILALALAAGLSPQAVSRMYLQEGQSIFDLSFWRRVGGVFGLTRAKYASDGLKKALVTVFGGTKLGDLSRRVAVTTFNLDDESSTTKSWSPKVYHNYPGDDSDGDERVVDVALRTSAAPTYFPSVDGYIDGGVFANNPSVVGLAQALDTRHFGNKGAPVELGDVRLFSLGTGASPKYLAGDDLDWGAAEWAKPLLDILFDGVSEVADFQCRQILRDSYYRRQFDLLGEMPMDAVSDLGKMVKFAELAPLGLNTLWVTKSGWLGKEVK